MSEDLSPPVALIVEDDTCVREMAVALLEESELAVVEASSAEEALFYLRDRAEGVVFLFSDVRLPCLMDGVDLARTVRAKWPWITTVVTSGAPLESDVPRDVAFLPKPWRPLDILVEAERARRRSRAE